MNDLAVGLGILGGLVLAGVVAHGAWKQRRVTPRQAGPSDLANDSDPTDPFGAQRIDPPLDSAAEAAGVGAGASDGARAGQVAPGQRAEPAADVMTGALTSSVIAPERRALLDPLIDVIAPISLEAPVSGDAALAALPSTRRAGSKPFLIEGLNEDTEEWESPQPGRRYTEFQAGVQLANRVGALNEIEFSEFVMKARAFADALGGEPDFPEMLDEVARARELDQFAGEHDAQLGFVLRPRTAAWSPGFVQQHAARLGFVAGVIPGRMVLPAAVSGEPPLVGLTFDSQAALADDPTQAAIRQVTLSLDVPQVPQADQPYARMCEAAALLAQAMDGAVTDDAGQPIGAQAMAQIGTELERIYAVLASRELAAGSMLARRLFS
ncbi:MAG: hypothetical protein RL014_2404 [Pseudomonadota bacterium]|jgi:hypothetical protein